MNMTLRLIIMLGILCFSYTANSELAADEKDKTSKEDKDYFITLFGPQNIVSVSVVLGGVFVAASGLALAVVPGTVCGGLAMRIYGDEYMYDGVQFGILVGVIKGVVITIYFLSSGDE